MAATSDADTVLALLKARFHAAAAGDCVEVRPSTTTATDARTAVRIVAFPNFKPSLVTFATVGLSTSPAVAMHGRLDRARRAQHVPPRQEMIVTCLEAFAARYNYPGAHAGMDFWEYAAAVQTSRHLRTFEGFNQPLVDFLFEAVEQVRRKIDASRAALPPRTLIDLAEQARRYAPSLENSLPSGRPWALAGFITEDPTVYQDFLSDRGPVLWAGHDATTPIELVWLVPLSMQEVAFVTSVQETAAAIDVLLNRWADEGTHVYDLTRSSARLPVFVRRSPRIRNAAAAKSPPSSSSAAAVRPGRRGR